MARGGRTGWNRRLSGPPLEVRVSETRYLLFISVCPGLEDLLLEEVEDILPGVKVSKREAGVEARVSASEIWSIARRTRMGETMRVRVGRFKATRYESLMEGLDRMAWAAYVPRGAVPPVQITCRKSRLSNPAAVKSRLQALLRARTEGIPATVAEPVLSIRLYKDRATISVDAGGEPLYKRGYQEEKAPDTLRETLAAACVRAAAIDPLQTVWDPFCGSGTIPIESVFVAPDADFTLAGRRFAFECWPTHDADAYAAATSSVRGDAGRRAFGSDVNLDEIRVAEADALRAGVEAECTFIRGDFESVASQIPEGSAVLSNLPYGRGLPTQELHEVFARFGAMLRERRDLNPVVVLDGTSSLEDATGCRGESLRRFSNEGVWVTMMQLVR